MSASSKLSRRFRIVWRTCSTGVAAYTPPLGPGINPLLAEQYSVSPAKTQGLAVGLGGMFFGRMERRLFRSRRSEEHTSELQSRGHLVCRLLLEKKKKKKV